MNDIRIHGYLGRDPELKEYHTSDGNIGMLVNFTVGVGRRRGDETDWFNCTAFGKRAEVIDRFFGKGSEIIVCGSMQNDKYEKDGQKRSSWKLIVSDFDFCGKKDKEGSKREDIPANFEEVEDDVPF